MYSLKGSYLLVPLSMLITVIFTFFDDEKQEGKKYMKKASLTGILVAFAILVNSMSDNNIEDMMTGPPEF